MRRKVEDLLYAPIGLIAGASQVIPELAEQGRIQVANARLMGRMATKVGSDKMAGHLGDVVAQTNGLLVRFGLVPPATPDVHPEASSTAQRPEAPVVVARDPFESPVGDAPDAEELAIVDYDSLAASQVVPRLVALEPDELEAVRRYEFANRGRKTILGRVAQLQS
ncbi:MAG TPA: hypothetical protein VFN21_03440 [Acidimicrobiales bacterium]|nr:hypothetical protein [Acidimicrobiales bacterium]